MTLQSVIVFVVLAAIVVPVILAEIGRRRLRRPAAKPARTVKREAATKTPLRLVVNRNDMDRELAALLAKDSRKSTDREE